MLGGPWNIINGIAGILNILKSIKAKLNASGITNDAISVILKSKMKAKSTIITKTIPHITL